MANLKPSTTNRYVNTDEDGKKYIDAIIRFLQIFLPISIARKIICGILIAAGVPSYRIILLTGLGESTVQSTGRALKNGNISDVLVHKNGSGRKSKTESVEEQILSELEKQDYHTHQQIADMIKDKFGISISLTAVSRLLKKTGLKG